ncbi:MAG: carbohydrate binding domain-containing protein [Phycisphaerae bacterium]|nr:carbohydrate binding domain-containing protein [Phycisphaerae bacterium]
MNSKIRISRRIPNSWCLLCISYGFCLSIIVVAFCSSRAVGAELVPFVIPSKPNPDSPIAAPPADSIDTNSARIFVRRGHFYLGDDGIRLWGVNLSFGANFPTHEAAPHVAARLAAAGVNSVRCHHMDTSRWPRGIWNAKDGKDIEPEALDRLDFFIDQLARRGIYVNINLHVGREHSKYLGLPEANRNYDKITNIFTPALVDAQKKYARDLLTHVNKYRKVRYADDPAIAIVEITNENSFFMWGSDETLRTLPEYYAKILQAKFNSWLKSKTRLGGEEFGSDDELGAAWSEGVQPLGDNILENGDFGQRQAGNAVPLHWNIEQHEGCRAWCSRQRLESRRALKIEIEKADDTEWHLQFNQRGLAVRKGQYYTVSFEAAADKPRRITCGVSQAGSPWSGLGLSRRVELTRKRTAYRLGFTATADEENARLSFSIGGSEIPIHLANIELRPGGRVGLKEGESLSKGNITLFAETESPQRTIDRMKFLAETEKAHFDEMRRFIKKDLKCDALVAGTIVFGPLGLYAQSDMDFIDAHAYWQHPRFPNRPWDQGDWLIDQKPMTDNPEQATLFRLAAKRLHDKPFTVSEYNHPAPLDSQAECVPMIASFAAAQGWSGLWLYTYSHSSDDWDRENMNSYFDIDTNPAKWGFMRSCAAIFADPRIRVVGRYSHIPFAGKPTTLESIAALHIERGGDMLGGFVNQPKDLLDVRLVRDIEGRFGEIENMFPSPKLKWLDEAGKGLYYAEGHGASAYTGHAGMFEEASDGRITIAEPEFLALTITSLDAPRRQKLDDSKKILITACGRCENTGMKFSEDRRTVGRDWGAAPVLIETVEGTVTLPSGRWKCQALGPDGTPKTEVPVITRDGESIIELSPKYKTMWYLLTRP